jgi:hypothetical protein
MSLKSINNERDLLNYEYSHLYNMVLYKGVTLNPVKTQRDLSTGEDYGLMIHDETGKKKQTLRFSSLERCQEEAAKRINAQVVRLGRNHAWKTGDVLTVSDPIDDPIGSFLALTDESGNIERLQNALEVNRKILQLISNELEILGYLPGSHPPAEILRDLAMRYNDICPDDFAVAVVKHCKEPSSYHSSTQESVKSVPSKSLEEKEAWYETPAGKQWLKEHSIPSIFKLPKPEYIHRRG